MTKPKPISSFTISTDIIRHVAFLTRLGIEEDEAREFSPQLTSIIDYFHLLNEVDTENVPPACETSNTRSAMRADKVLPSMPTQYFLKNVPRCQGDLVQVPLVFSEE